MWLVVLHMSVLTQGRFVGSHIPDDPIESENDLDTLKEHSVSRLLSLRLRVHPDQVAARRRPRPLLGVGFRA